MDEEKIKGKKKEETAQGSEKEGAGDSEAGDKPGVYKPIDDANLAAKRMEDANKERRELLDREEEMIAKRALGGITEAGTAPENPKEETPLEYRNKVMSGALNKEE